jgi:hypothetical protein
MMKEGRGGGSVSTLYYAMFDEYCYMMSGIHGDRSCPRSYVDDLRGDRRLLSIEVDACLMHT